MKNLVIATPNIFTNEKALQIIILKEAAKLFSYQD